MGGGAFPLAHGSSELRRARPIQTAVDQASAAHREGRQSYVPEGVRAHTQPRGGFTTSRLKCTKYGLGDSDGLAAYRSTS